MEEYLKLPSILIGSILDLSGGGLRVSIPQKLSLNSKVLLSFCINDEEINIVGNVVRILDGQVYGIEYECMKENIRDRIIKYIFESMRKK